MAPAVERFFARGAGPRMMNIVLSGSNGEAEAYFKVPSLRKVGSDDLLLYSLEITGTDGYWIEFSRAADSRENQRPDAGDGRSLSARYGSGEGQMRDGVPASEVHKAAADIFAKPDLRWDICPGTPSA